MNCKTIQRWISLAVDGALPAKENEVLQEHIAGCAACQAEWEGQQKLRSVLHAIPAPEIEASVLPALRARLNEREARLVWMEDIERFARRFVPAAAVLLLVLSGLAVHSAVKRFRAASEIHLLVLAEAQPELVLTDDPLAEMAAEENSTELSPERLTPEN